MEAHKRIQRKIKWLAIALSFGVALHFSFALLPAKTSNTIQAVSKKKATLKFAYAFGVFNGVDRIVPAFSKYKTIVLDAEGFSKSQIMKLRKQGHIVYSYVNVGAWEKSRKAERRFYKKTLKAYDGWPDERWMNVTDTGWKQYLKQKTATYKKKGIQGFFLDNFDVYDISHKKATYQSLQSILKQMQTLRLPILINGGSTFVKQSLKERQKRFTAVVQEDVFSYYDAKRSTYKKQRDAETKAYLSYISYCQKRHVKVYIIEYVRKNPALKKKIQRYCQTHHITYYISDNINLE